MSGKLCGLFGPLNLLVQLKIIQELQAKKEWSGSTIKTLLRRLVNKNLLATSKEGRRFIYSSKINQTQVMTEAAQELLNRMCDMHKGEVLLQLLANSPISKSDLAKIKQKINEKEKSAFSLQLSVREKALLLGELKMSISKLSFLLLPLP